MSANWKRQLNIMKNNTYNFPLCIPKFHRFPYHSSPTLLIRLSPILTLLQFQQHPSLHHHSLPLIQHCSFHQQSPPHHYLPIIFHHSLHQQSPPFLSQMFSLHYIYQHSLQPYLRCLAQMTNPRYSYFPKGNTITQAHLKHLQFLSTSDCWFSLWDISY